jgi:hypothetical protein
MNCQNRKVLQRDIAELKRQISTQRRRVWQSIPESELQESDEDRPFIVLPALRDDGIVHSNMD